MSDTREDETEVVFQFRRYLELNAVTSAADFPLSEMTPDSKIIVEERERRFDCSPVPRP